MFAMFSKNVDKVTVVFDKGNNTKDNLELLDNTPYHFVGPLKPYNYKHFLDIPIEGVNYIYKKKRCGISKYEEIYPRLVGLYGDKKAGRNKAI